jgi:hypothetical protein
MELIIFLLLVVLVTLIFVIGMSQRYNNMLNGTVVGTYKGNKTSGGYIVVEMINPVEDSLGYVNKKKVQRTYEVPSEYYDKVKIGDTGVFPY